MMRLTKIIMSVMISFPMGCTPTPIKNIDHENSSNKYYIGRADTENFQESIKKILLDFDYHIEEYENGPTSSYIYTHWKIREPCSEEIDAGFEDAKTRLVINGMIDNGSFTRNNGFSYECFLVVENHLFDGKKYVEYYEDGELKDEILTMVNTFSNLLIKDG